MVKDDDGKYHYISPDKYELETFLEIKYDKNGHVKGQHYRKKKIPTPKRTSIGKSKNTRPKNKHKKKNWKKYRGQG